MCAALGRALSAWKDLNNQLIKMIDLEKGKIAFCDIVSNEADLIRELSKVEKEINVIILSLPMILHKKIYQVRLLNLSISA